MTFIDPRVGQIKYEAPCQIREPFHAAVGTW